MGSVFSYNYRIHYLQSTGRLNPRFPPQNYEQTWNTGDITNSQTKYKNI